MTTDPNPVTSTKKPRRVPWIIGLAAVLVLTLGGGTWAVNANNTKALAATQAAWAAVSDDFVALAKDAKTATDAAQTAVDSSEGKVADNQVRENLAAAITTLEARLGQELPTPAERNKNELEAAISQVTEHNSAITRDTAAIATAQTSVENAVVAWELGQAQDTLATATTDLAAVIAAGEKTVKDLSEKVTDAKTIEGLNKAIQDAKTALGAEVDQANLEALDAATTALATGAETTTNAIKSVAESNQAWVNAETEKKAVAEKTEAQVNNSRTPSAKAPSTTKQPPAKAPGAKKPGAVKPAPQPKPTTPKAPAPKPKPNPSAPSGGGWVESTVDEKVCWAGGTDGKPAVQVPCK